MYKNTIRILFDPELAVCLRASQETAHQGERCQECSRSRLLSRSLPFGQDIS